MFMCVQLCPPTTGPGRPLIMPPRHTGPTIGWLARLALSSNLTLCRPWQGVTAAVARQTLKCTPAPVRELAYVTRQCNATKMALPHSVCGRVSSIAKKQHARTRKVFSLCLSGLCVFALMKQTEQANIALVVRMCRHTRHGPPNEQQVVT